MVTRRHLSLVLAAVALATVTAGLAWWRFTHRSDTTTGMVAYVGSAQCAACHQQAWEQWRQSDHHHAMAVAGPGTVLGNFEDATFQYFGRTSRFFRRDGQYFVETDDATGASRTFRIAYAFGHDPLQQYLIEFPDGRLQALGIAWDSRPADAGGQRWYHLYPDQEVDAGNALHWTGAFQNWNSRCASCHSTGLSKGYSVAEDQYATRWQEINVGCEACHGPGSTHLAWAAGDRAAGDRGLGEPLRATWTASLDRQAVPVHADPASSRQLQVCAGCHSRRQELRQSEAHAGYFDNFALSPLLADRYFVDGQAMEEVFVTGSFLQSRMHQNHVSCSNCHEPHSGRPRIAGNGLCGQCHEPSRFDTREHSFHEPGSSGSQCVSCHMPARTYMGVDQRRDHSFRIPDPVASVEFGVPNACTSCHSERNDRWAADFMIRRTGRSTPRYPHAALLDAARRGDADAGPSLLQYAADAAHPPILRAIALIESANLPSPGQVDTASRALASQNPLIRSGAIAALARVDPAAKLRLLQPLLQDPVKSVRLDVARELAHVPLWQAPPDARPALTRLLDEYRHSLGYNADMPEAMNELALLEAAQGDPDAAEKALHHALRLAPRYLPAMLNLADLHRARGRDDLGEPLLNDAIREYPESADAPHAMGLLYVRTGRTTDSVALFAAASRLAPGNSRYALAHALSLLESGRNAEGRRVLAAAARRFPEDQAIREALRAYGR